MFDAKQYGPWAVIAGASEGVGMSFARRLAREGLNLVLLARKQAGLDDVAAEVRAESGVEVRTLALDLTAADMLERVRGVTDDVEVGLLVYVAGANQSMASFYEAPLEAALRVVRLNPIGQVSLSYHFGKKMLERGRGGIALLGSMAGNAGATPLVAYSASKAFTQNFCEGLWAELKPHGVDVLYVLLGATQTPNRARQSAKDKSNHLVEEADSVVDRTLANLDNGPVQVPEHLWDQFREFCTLPRREAVEAMVGVLRAFKGD
jgi:short-subunit dehydrogenase